MNYTLPLTIVLVVISWALLFTLWSRNTLLIKRTAALPINSPDNNISTTRIEKIIMQAKLFFGIGDVEVIYGESSSISLIKSYSKRKNRLIIPKIKFESVGYEIDWILGYIWFTSKLLIKDKQFLFFMWIFKWLILLLYLLLLLSSLFSIVLIVFSINNFDFFQDSNVLQIMYRFQIFSIVAVVLSFIVVLLSSASYNWKENIELKFEKEIATFIKDAIEDYREDFVTARYFAHEIKQFYLPSFAKTNNASDYKYLGVFNLH